MSAEWIIASITALVMVWAFVIWLGTPNPSLLHRSVVAIAETVFGMFSCLVKVVLALVALFVVIWIIKRMWEAA